MVHRIIVDKGTATYCRDASRIYHYLCDVLMFEHVDDVQVFLRYDVEGLTSDEFDHICENSRVFNSPNEDVYFDHSDVPAAYCTFVMQEPEGQYDSRADNAAQAIALITGKERPTVRCAMIVSIAFENEKHFDYDYFFDNLLTYDAFNFLKDKVCEKFSLELGSESLPDYLHEHYFTPEGVRILRKFNSRNAAELEAFRQKSKFAMSFEDLQFCQHYFRDIARRSPTVTELQAVDTYWSDHCRHTTFNSVIDNVYFKEGKYKSEFESAFAEYIVDKMKVNAAKKAEIARREAERAEEARLAAEKAEAERIEAEKSEAQRLAEKQAEEARIAAEKAEAERIAAEKKYKRKLAAEKAAITRLRKKREAEAKLMEEMMRLAEEQSAQLQAERAAAEENPVAEENPAAECAADNNPVTLMDLGTIAAKSLKIDGVLTGVEETDEVNACSIEITANVDGRAEDWLVMYKNETHNHPTEIEPYGGAATCLGGAIRDPLSGRSYIYQALRITGAADPRKPLSETLEGKLPQRVITQEAARGFSSYGNQIGLATGQVHEIYHEGYLAKRMEIGAVIGAAPKENVIRGQPVAGDLVVLVGGRTGRDGIGGATGSSKVHTTDSINTCGAEVQKGNPLTERKIQRLFRNPKVSRLIKRCNDFGAGGVAVAVGELADGLEINLDAVRKKYEGLDGTELAISESQERMAVVLAPENLDEFLKFADAENVEAYVIAKVTEKNKLVMLWRGDEIVNIDRDFLNTNGVRQHASVVVARVENYTRQNLSDDVKTAWLKNLQKLNVCSQRGLVEMFDSTVGAGTILMPYGGRNQLTPSEGCAAKLPVHGETKTATAMTFGFDAKISAWSPYHGAIDAVTSSLAKLTAMGADSSKAYLSFQEYFERLGDDPEKWGKPFAALLGAYKAQKRFGVAAIGGKDSMSGTYEKLNVPPTLVSFAVAAVDADWVISPEFKSSGNKVYLIECVRDEYNVPEFRELKRKFAAVHQHIRERKIISAISVGVGGIAEAISKMAIGNDIGFRFEESVRLFEKNYGSLLVEAAAGVELDFTELGETIAAPQIEIGDVKITLDEIKRAWSEPLEKIFPTQVEPQKKSDVKVELYKAEVRHKAKLKVAKPKVFIPVFPGTNCEHESARCWRYAGAKPNELVVRNLTPAAIEETVAAFVDEIRNSQIIMIPGGFSAGDEPDGSGKFIAAMFSNPRIAEEVARFLQRDGLILGICNGFQALIRLGLLPYGEIRTLDKDSPELKYNTIGRHVSRMVRTRVTSNLSPWLSGNAVGDVHTIAVSHGEGRFFANDEWLKKLAANGQIATQYVDFDGNPTDEFPDNPNGSVLAIEGITSADGRIFGKMGHSERIGDNVCKNVPGNKNQHLFEAGVNYFS